MFALSARKSLFYCHCVCEEAQTQRNIHDETTYIPLWLKRLCSDEFLYPTSSGSGLSEGILAHWAPYWRHSDSQPVQTDLAVRPLLFLAGSVSSLRDVPAGPVYCEDRNRQAGDLGEAGVLLGWVSDALRPGVARKSSAHRGTAHDPSSIRSCGLERGRPIRI